MSHKGELQILTKLMKGNVMFVIMRFIEKEFHFLCVCNANIEFRNVLSNNIYNVYHNFYNMTDKDKFVYLMEFHWKDVSVYLEKAWEKRTDILYKQT